MELKNSKTAKNIMTALSAECMAKVKYDFYAERAHGDGYEEIAEVFNLTSDNEFAHAKVLFRMFVGKGSDTLANLKDASKGENFEGSEMYPTFAEVAEDEGFTDIANTFRLLANIEIAHRQRYDALASNIEKGTVFEKPEEVEWLCLNCGHTQKGTSAPQKCPTCNHPQSYFKVKN